MKKIFLKKKIGELQEKKEKDDSDNWADISVSSEDEENNEGKIYKNKNIEEDDFQN